MCRRLLLLRAAAVSAVFSVLPGPAAAQQRGSERRPPYYVLLKQARSQLGCLVAPHHCALHFLLPGYYTPFSSIRARRKSTSTASLLRASGRLGGCLLMFAEAPDYGCAMGWTSDDVQPSLTGLGRCGAGVALSGVATRLRDS